MEDDPSSTKNGSWESREGCYIIVVNVNRLLAKKESSEEGRMRGPFGPQDPDPSAGVVKTSLKTNITITGAKRGRVGGSFATVDGIRERGE